MITSGGQRSTIKRILALIMVGLIAVGGTFLSRQVSAQTGPGTAEDPVVTKSYVDQFFVPKIVELEAGQTIIGEAGTQFDLRVGTVYCLADPAYAKGGLSDVTAGMDIGHMQPISLNHLLICPRSDGRGLFAQTSAIVMVWGVYKVLGS